MSSSRFCLSISSSSNLSRSSRSLIQNAEHLTRSIKAFEKKKHQTFREHVNQNESDQVYHRQGFSRATRRNPDEDELSQKLRLVEEIFHEVDMKRFNHFVDLE